MERSQFIDKLMNEVRVWREKSIISSEQEKAISLYYQEEGDYQGASSSRFIQTITVIGSVLVGLGIILFFAANWDTMTNVAKTALIVASMLSVYAAGYILYYQRGYQKTGYALILLASILYGSGIFLLGQIYNIGGEFHDGMLFWLLGVLPLAYVTKMRGLLVISILLFYGYVFGYIGDRFGSFGSEAYMALLIASTGLFFVNLTRVHELKYPEFSRLLHMVGVFAIFLSAFMFTFEWSYFRSGADFGMVAIISGFLLTSVILRALDFVQKKHFSLKSESGNVIHLLVLAGLTLFLYRYMDAYAGFISDHPDYLLIFLNVYFVLMVLFAVYLGTLLHKPYLINISIFFFIVFMIAKYFDWFYDMMDRAMFFIVGGLILIGGGLYLEKKRRKLVDTIRSESR